MLSCSSDWEKTCAPVRAGPCRDRHQVLAADAPVASLGPPAPPVANRGACQDAGRTSPCRLYAHTIDDWPCVVDGDDRLHARQKAQLCPSAGRADVREADRRRNALRVITGGKVPGNGDALVLLTSGTCPRLLPMPASASASIFERVTKRFEDFYQKPTGPESAAQQHDEHSLIHRTGPPTDSLANGAGRFAPEGRIVAAIRSTSVSSGLSQSAVGSRPAACARRG